MDIACRVYSIMEHPVLITTQQIKTMVIQLVDHEKTHKKLKSGQLIVITEIQNCHFCDTSSKQDYFRQHTSWETNKKSCNQYTHLYNLFLLKLHFSCSKMAEQRRTLQGQASCSNASYTPGNILHETAIYHNPHNSSNLDAHITR